MRSWWSACLGLLSALGLYSCDWLSVRELKPGVSTGYEVRERMGPPTHEWKEPDGTLVWEFSRQPEGIQNYMAVIGPDNILRELRQVLGEESFARIQPGMTREQVRRLLGRPANAGHAQLKREEVWDWKYESSPEADSYFHVHFAPDGDVLRTSRSTRHKSP